MNGTKRDFENAEGAFYSCASHPDEQSDREGFCARCGNPLRSELWFCIYACPHHRELKFNRPGECPACGTSLIWFI
jgi:hypothetical protein